MALTYLDFDLEISHNAGHHYLVTVRSQASQAHQIVAFPFSNAELETHLLKVENAILRSSSTRRRNPTPDEAPVQLFGQCLFDFLLTGELLSQYRECQREANHQGKGVRVRLHIHAPLLATLPWEFLYDPRKRDYLCLDPNTPLVRYTDLTQTPPALMVQPPLRILGMVTAPANATQLDVAAEKQRLTTAIQPLQQQGLLELTWLEG
ncbi:hypothetical protein BH10CHL1_BH10CHL1_09680 [soil metagenome]